MHDVHGHPHHGSSMHSLGGHTAWFREILEDLRGGRPSVRRGDVRSAILGVLLDGPMHGYQVIREIEARTDGRWRPSAGSIYPTLQLLEDEGIVRSEELQGRRTYVLTDEGVEAAGTATAGGPPWVDAGSGAEELDVRRDAMELVQAALQVSRAGSVNARQEARRLLVDARREMYRLLADDEPESTRA